VTATAVWTEKSKFLNSGKVGVDAFGKRTAESVLPADFDDPRALRNLCRKSISDHVLGATHTSPRNNIMVMEFTVKPAGIGQYNNIVLFDISRAKAVRVWETVNGARKLTRSEDFPKPLEKANDDDDHTDEDNRPTNDHIYVFDSPGMGEAGNKTRYEQQLNMWEFVRVLIKKSSDTSFANTQPGRGIVQGSRASQFVPWWSREDWTKVGNKWTSTAGPAGTNAIEEGQHPPFGM
jgi:hypothetical protein